MRVNVSVGSVGNRYAFAVACGIAAVLVASCSQQEPGSPSPSTTSQSQGAGASAAPPVSNPKNLKAQPACQLLTAAQLSDLGATATPKPDTSVWGEGKCKWINDEVSLYISPDTTQGKGLSGVYKNLAGSAGFQSLTIAGYPAARTGGESNECAIAVGTSNTQVFLIDLTLFGSRRASNEDPCALAQKVGADVLSNLPAGQ
jgi:uncharacterized Zn-binding protein involved in type VI secretion